MVCQGSPFVPDSLSQRTHAKMSKLLTLSTLIRFIAVTTELGWAISAVLLDFHAIGGVFLLKVGFAWPGCLEKVLKNKHIPNGGLMVIYQGTK